LKAVNYLHQLCFKDPSLMYLEFLMKLYHSLYETEILVNVTNIDYQIRGKLHCEYVILLWPNAYLQPVLHVLCLLNK